MTGDDRLKKAFSKSGGDAASPGGCPGDETIWAAARGELPPDRVQEVLDHSLHCASCEESFRMAAGMMAEMHEAGVSVERATPGETTASSLREPERAPAEIRPFPVRRSFVLAVGAIAAAILVAIALPAVLRRADAPSSVPSLKTLDETIATTLWRVGTDGDEPLTGGETIRPGDRLYLTLESDEPVHLYMINRDEAGVESLLFPVAEAQWSNPLQPGAARRIPGETTWDYDSWEVSSAGGRDSFIIVASRAPIARLETVLDQIASAAPQGSDEHLRGGEGRPGDSELPGGKADGVDASAALSETLRALSSASGRDTDLLVREIFLENPR